MGAFDSIFVNNIQALREYLELGDVNVINERGLSLLHYAILFNNSEIFDLLLENYINVDIKDSFGNTPAHYCVINNRMGFLKTLIRHNCNLELQNNDLRTPLYLACLLGRENMVSLLLETVKFDILEEDIKKETIFMALVRSRNLDLLNKVVVTDSIVNRGNYLGETPLHIACKSGDLEVCQYLLMNNAFINQKNKMKETPLFYAIQGLNMEVVALLLANGACIDIKSSFGDSIFDITPNNNIDYLNDLIIRYKSNEYKSLYPLHHAILIENYNLVLKHAVIKNINRKDSFGFTPNDLAIKMGNERIIDALKRVKNYNI